MHFVAYFEFVCCVFSAAAAGHGCSYPRRGPLSDLWTRTEVNIHNIGNTNNNYNTKVTIKTITCIASQFTDLTASLLISISEEGTKQLFKPKVNVLYSYEA